MKNDQFHRKPMYGVDNSEGDSQPSVDFGSEVGDIDNFRPRLDWPMLMLHEDEDTLAVASKAEVMP